MPLLKISGCLISILTLPPFIPKTMLIGILKLKRFQHALCRRCGAQEENIEYLFHYKKFKEKPVNLKNLLKTDPAKLKKILKK